MATIYFFDSEEILKNRFHKSNVKIGDIYTIKKTDIVYFTNIDKTLVSGIQQDKYGNYLVELPRTISNYFDNPIRHYEKYTYNDQGHYDHNIINVIPLDKCHNFVIETLTDQYPNFEKFHYIYQDMTINEIKHEDYYVINCYPIVPKTQQFEYYLICFKYKNVPHMTCVSKKTQQKLLRFSYQRIMNTEYEIAFVDVSPIYLLKYQVCNMTTHYNDFFDTINNLNEKSTENTNEK